MSTFSTQFNFGNTEVTLQTGEIARQASGAVVVSMGDTTVLATVVVDKSKVTEQNFLPLTVQYQEKFYASGRIPGGYFRREGRPTEKETLTSRLIDRPIRPLFPKQFRHEIQVICTILSADDKVDPDIAAMLGASAALAIAGVPWSGPIGAIRVGKTEQEYIINPSYDTLKTSSLNMVVAGTEDAVLMVESEASELSEDEMLAAVMFAHSEMQVAIKHINELVAQVGVEEFQWQSGETSNSHYEEVKQQYTSKLEAAYSLVNKTERLAELKQLRDQLLNLTDESQANTQNKEQLLEAFAQLERELVRGKILSGGKRIDGRDNTTVRDINITLPLLQKTHGSSLFTRGETQAIVTCTLGDQRRAQSMETLHGDERVNFMLHYNFPPYSVGEAGRLGGTSRRETGHGKLAQRALNAVLPDWENEFLYSIRVVSEITESNGSSSMATVCGASLSLMDAGVPIKRPVAGVAMGLIKEGDNFVVLTDILGDEDHLGDMDFKVAGTANGVTALQMDIKIAGVNEDVMKTALMQALEARLHVLGKMNEALDAPREDLSSNLSQQVRHLTIPKQNIKNLIGKGGVTIKGICDRNDCKIDVNDDGKVTIFASGNESFEKIISEVNATTRTLSIGDIVEGKVTAIKDFGAFIEISPGKDGLLHISEIANRRIDKVSEVLEEGQSVRVEIIDMDDAKGRVSLSMKNIN